MCKKWKGVEIMTFKEKLAIDHPEHLNPDMKGGCYDCPHTYGYETVHSSILNCKSRGGKGCDYCWNREIPDTSSDAVNSPSHYTGKYECIDVMLETQGVVAVKAFCRCNVFKYLYRSQRKNGLEDIKKAQWYLNKLIELEEQDDTELADESRS